VYLLYSLRIVKVTSRFATGVIAATGGLVLLYMVVWLLSLFGVDCRFLCDVVHGRVNNRSDHPRRFCAGSSPNFQGCPLCKRGRAGLRLPDIAFGECTLEVGQGTRFTVRGVRMLLRWRRRPVV
jgi:Bax inhibitor 1 like